MDASQVELLREALPYIRRFKGKTFVVKLGGQVAEDAAHLSALAEEIALCQQVGFRMLVVHGGGKQVTELAQRLGVRQTIVDGRRVTDQETLEIAKMVLAGKINMDIQSTLRRLGVSPVGLSGLDGNILRARKRALQKVVDPQTGREDWIDYGHVGDIIEVNSQLLTILLDHGYLPVISCLGADDEGNIYNINADTVAAEIAAHVQAEKFILLTNTDGIYRDMADPASKISRLTLSEAEELIEKGSVSAGMIPKLVAAMFLLRHGVGGVHILNGRRRNALLQEIFTDEGTGTMLTAG